jgi:murein DD-endopeptidase MepM/ murein hydrolase activator NlpD
MLRNYLTVMVIPQKSGKIFKFEISAFLLKLLLLTIVIITIASSGIFVDYTLKKGKSRNMRELQNAIMLQKLSIQNINNMIQSRQNELADLEKFDRKLRLISGLQESGMRIRYIGNGNNYSEVRNQKRLDGRVLLAKLKKLDLDTKLREISFFQLGANLHELKDKLARTPSIPPASGHISSRFGKRRHPFTGKIQFHRGLDIANREYTPIYAPADGIVDNTRTEGDLGLFLVIHHGYNIVTRYGHLAKFEVKAGRKVKRGDLIARIGDTGRSTAPHLHYEVLINDQYVDPEKFIFWDK